MPEDVILSMKMCVTGYGWTDTSDVFRKIMTSLPVMKQLMVSYSAAEAVIFFKCCNLHVRGKFDALAYI